MTVAPGITSSKTAKPPVRMMSLSSTMMTLGEPSLSAAAFISMFTPTPRHWASRDIMTASGKRLPFSHRATVGWVTYITFASPRCESPPSVLSFLRVSANSMLILQRSIDRVVTFTSCKRHYRTSRKTQGDDRGS